MKAKLSWAAVACAILVCVSCTKASAISLAAVLTVTPDVIQPGSGFVTFDFTATLVGPLDPGYSEADFPVGLNVTISLDGAEGRIFLSDGSFVVITRGPIMTSCMLSLFASGVSSPCHLTFGDWVYPSV